MADMASHRATVTMPVRDGCRDPSASQEASSLPAPPVEVRHGSVSAAISPAEPASPSPGVDAGAPVAGTERYLAPALKAAAAARARTARIRGAARAAAAGPAWPYPREWLFAPPDQSPAAPPDPLPAALPPASPPARDLQLAETAAVWPLHALAGPGAAGPGGLRALSPSPSPPASRGLSVAEAARASRIGFRPLHRQPPARLEPPSQPPSHPVERPTLGAAPPAAAAPATAVAAVTSPGTAAAAAPTVPPRTAAPAMPSTPAGTVTRPGAARLLLPADAGRRALPERTPRQQRFAKTIAELQRYQAATRPAEPWGNVVPRPAVPQSGPASPDSRWSRLWSRR